MLLPQTTYEPTLIRSHDKGTVGFALTDHVSALVAQTRNGYSIALFQGQIVISASGNRQEIGSCRHRGLTEFVISPTHELANPGPQGERRDFCHRYRRRHAHTE